MAKNKSEAKKIQQTVDLQKDSFLSKKITKAKSLNENNCESSKNNISASQGFFTSSSPTQKHRRSELLHTLSHPAPNLERKLTKAPTQNSFNTALQKFTNSVVPSKNSLISHEKNSLENHFIFTNSPPSSHYTSKNIVTSNNTSAFKQSESICYIAVAPAHLRGLDAISKIFGKSRGTIRSWYQKGAPIAYDGISYCSEYNTLFIWYLKHHKYYDLKQPQKDSLL